MALIFMCMAVVFLCMAFIIWYMAVIFPKKWSDFSGHWVLPTKKKGSARIYVRPAFAKRIKRIDPKIVEPYKKTQRIFQYSDEATRDNDKKYS